MVIVVCCIMVLQAIAIVILSIACRRKIDKKDSEYFTDYRHKNMVLRVFKPEFEYQAIGNVQRGKLLDRGTLSQFYFWALIEL